jgi:bifunctional N-acetylglucosamine-1-phosphate-uridyltransferase/glucosamine-1-phosphate-acetyltransferase GlmU-like protein
MTSNKPTLLVLAAGMGSRYGGLKQLDPVGPNGETIMDYSIHDARQAGFTRVVFLIREDIAEVFREKIGSKYLETIEVGYAYQEKQDLPVGFNCPVIREKPWGTGHAVWAARNEIEGCPFAVINADDFYGAETFEVLYRQFSEPSMVLGKDELSCAMVGFLLAETMSEHGAVSRGVCRTKDGMLKNVEEWTGIQGSPITGTNSMGEVGVLSGEELVSMNVWAFPSGVFGFLEKSFVGFLNTLSDPAKEEFYLPFAVDQWIKQEIAHVQIKEAKCRWMGVTYKEDKPRVQESIKKMVEEGLYLSPLSLG